MMKPSGIQVNKPVVGVLLLAFGAIIWYVKFSSVSPPPKAVLPALQAQDSLPRSAERSLSDSSGAEVPAAVQGNKMAAQSAANQDPVNAQDQVNSPEEAVADHPVINPPTAAAKAATCCIRPSAQQGGVGGRKSDVPLPEVDFTKVKALKSSVKVQNGATDIDVVYLEVKPAPSEQDVLLLHGASFNASTWEGINTIQVLGALGFRTVAVNLPGPGFGKTTSNITPDDPVQFMGNLIKALELKAPVIVSPSLSGTFSLPLLLQAPENFGGFVPVAPVISSQITDEKLKAVKIPTMIVYGSTDTGLGARGLQKLCHIPGHTVYELEGGHAVYLNQPAQFNTLLYNFLLSLAGQ